MIVNSLTTIERKVLANQYEILSKLSENDGEKEMYSNFSKILEHGYAGLYSEIFGWVGEEKPILHTKEIHEILSMYRIINNSISRLSEEELGGLNLALIKFNGFDSHGAGHYSQAVFMIESLNLYQELKGIDIDSASSYSLAKYKTILSIFRKFELSGAKNWLTREELLEIISEVQN